MERLTSLLAVRWDVYTASAMFPDMAYSGTDLMTGLGVVQITCSLHYDL